MQISSESTEFVKVPVGPMVNGAPYDPSGDDVALAFTARNVDPATDDWHVGSWEASGDPTYPWQARLLVGPGAGGLVLAAGLFDIWLKVTDNPEVPVRKVGVLEVV